ncbi:MAG: ABC transporter permease [Patescibacteria group bacterium]|jgi:putative ABC transport system permease protein
MRSSDYIKTAFKNLWRQKTRSILTIISIVIGAVVIILIASLAANAKKAFREQLEKMGGLSLVTVSPSATLLDSRQGFFTESGCTEECKKLDDKTVAEFKRMANVTDVSPSATVNFNKMYIKGETKRRWSMFTGLEAGTKTIKIPIIAGRELKKDDIGSVVLGMEAVKYFGYTEKPKELVGKKLVIMTQGWYSGWGAEVPKPDFSNAKKDQDELQNKIIEFEVEIVGVASSPSIDGQNFITLDFAKELSVDQRWEYDEAEQKRRQMSGLDSSKMNPPMYLKTSNRIIDNGYSSILVKADTPDSVAGIADKIEKMGYGTTTSKDALADLMEMLTGLSIMLSIIGGIALFVAGIGIVNTMVMSMYERTYEIGVMRACGATRATIRRLFTFEAAMIGFWGGVFGLFLCYGLAQVANHYLAIYLPRAGITNDISLTFPTWLILSTLAFTTFIGMMAGIYPAIRAAKLDPVEALRYE